MVRVFDLRDGSPVATHRAAEDTLNGFEFHPYLPFAASTSGAQLTLRHPDMLAQIHIERPNIYF